MRPGSLVGLWRDPLGFFADLARTQGDFAHVRIGWQHLYLAGHPGLVSELLVDRHAEFGKGAPLRKARVLLGDGLLTSEGPVHQRQRRLIQPAFHRRRIAAYVDVMARYADALQATWRPGLALDATAAMMRLAQRVVAKSLFDADVEDAAAREAGRALDTLVRGFGLLLLPLSSWWLALPIPAAVRLRRARRTLDAMIVRMIADREATGDRGDVLSMLLFAEDADGKRMSTTQVRDEAMTLFLAGHDTTGNALAWTWHLLADHSAAETTWHRELDTVLGGRPVTADDVPRLRYTRQVLAESMRLFPPVPLIGRRARVAVDLGGLRIPRGAIVECSPWLLHRDPRFFADPASFRPERWTPEFERELPRGAYLPFGIGPRQCIGSEFAWVAGVVLLATIGRRWRLRRHDDRPVTRLPRSITLRPKHGVWLRLERRDEHT